MDIVVILTDFYKFPYCNLVLVDPCSRYSKNTKFIEPNYIGIKKPLLKS